MSALCYLSSIANLTRLKVVREKPRFTLKTYTNYTFPRLRSNIPSASDTVSIENIKNFFHKARNYMFGYLEGFIAGQELEKQLKNIKNNISLTEELVLMTDAAKLIFPIATYT